MSAYRGVWAALARWFRVPEEPPTIPLGRAETAESFRPAAGFLRLMRLRWWLVAAPVGAPLAALAIVLLFVEPAAGLVVLFLLAPPAAACLLCAWVAIRLRYDTTWYVLTERSVRMRRGIWSIRETTVTFENVQNVRLRQGPLQRACGVSDVVLETAAAAAGAEGAAAASVAAIEGVADAARIRDLVMARVRRSRGAGLGDEAEPGSGGGPAWSGAHLAVLREIREAAGWAAEAADRGKRFS